MAEVTRVPLKPLSRGSLLMLFIGILLGLAIAGGIAWFTAPAGVDVEEVVAGKGDHPKESDVVFVHYTGKLKDGTVFDKSQDIPLPVEGILPKGTPLPLQNMLPGFREGMLEMQKGGKYVLTIPAEKAYGANPPPGSPIPANADLTFDIELVDFMPMAEAERRIQQLQMMMMQQQQQQGGAAAGEGAGVQAPVPAPAPTPQ
ncbi:MAG: FKBP-type peptidyl-prolyl cis-trans isomerase [Porphyrobacter sp.]|nr:FKBP-type peptidyl-prolyl cis-trans isomerase [Porphyrobacter sp.]